MTQHRNLDYGQRLPEAVLDALQELLGTYVSANLKLTQLNPTTLQVVSSSENGQTSLSVQGRWRFNTATVSAAHPGGADGTYDVYATASDNVFIPGDPETDDTVYAYAIQIKPSGSFPATALYRKIGTCVWASGAITSFDMVTRLPVPNLSIITALLADLAVTTAKLADGSVTSVKIADATITGADIAAATVALANLAANSVDSSKIVDGSIASGDIANGAILLAHLAANSVDSSKIVDASITVADLAQAVWTTVHGQGLFAARPAAAAGNNGYLYLATDVSGGTLYRSNGTTWTSWQGGVSRAVGSIGDGATKQIDYVHNLGTRDVYVAVRRTASPYDLVYPSAAALDVNTVRLYFAVAPASGEFTVIVSGGTYTGTPSNHAGTHVPGGSDPINWASVNMVGLLANIPAASTGNNGTFYFATDDNGGRLWRSNGTTWVKASRAVSEGLIVASTIAGLGTAVDGKQGLLRLGTTPYEFALVTYDATYGKWVSEQRQIMQLRDAKVGGNLTDSHLLEFDSGGNAGNSGTAAVLPFKAFTDAGLTLMLRIAGMADSLSVGTKIGARISHGNAGDAVTSGDDDNWVGRTDFEMFTFAASGQVFDTGWVNATVPASPRALLNIVGAGRRNGTEIRFNGSYMSRWVG